MPSMRLVIGTPVLLLVIVTMVFFIDGKTSHAVFELWGHHDLSASSGRPLSPALPRMFGGSGTTSSLGPSLSVAIAASPKPSYSNAHRTALLPDSVSVLLFAQTRLRDLSLVSDGAISVNGIARSVRSPITVLATPDGIVTDVTKTASMSIGSIDRSTIIIRAGGRTRRIQGRVTIEFEGDELRTVAHVAIDDYLAATLAAETTEADPLEFLVALSVLQRNYVLTHAERHAPHADLCDNSHCQVAAAPERIDRIAGVVRRARRIELTAGEGHPCYYSANCGGSTLTPGQIWRESEPGYSSVVCEHCRGAKWRQWTRSSAATSALDREIRAMPPPPFIDDDFKIRVGRLIGFNIVLSNTVDRIERRQGRYIFHGRGFGHRVGMCKEGGRRLARNGMRAPDILRFYFPKARISNN